ncbi:MAG: hypothetical protein V3S82_00850 [Dehalococcoidia bacterium]
MSYSYEVVLPSNLSALFLESFEWALSMAGFETVMKLQSPQAPLVIKSKRGEDYISCSVQEAKDENERIVIESEVSDFHVLVLAAAQAAAGDFLTRLLEPLSQVDEADLRQRVRLCLSGLEAELQPRKK